jgi:hypothetical protein
MSTDPEAPLRELMQWIQGQLVVFDANELTHQAVNSDRRRADLVERLGTRFPSLPRSADWQAMVDELIEYYALVSDEAVELGRRDGRIAVLDEAMAFLRSLGISEV